MEKTTFLVFFYGCLVQLEKKITITSSNTFLDHLVCWLWRKKRLFWEDIFFPFLKANCRKRSEGELSYDDCRSDYVTISGNPISNYFFAWGLIDKKYYFILSLVFYYKTENSSSHGNTGCRVIEWAVKDKKDFCLRINIPEGNYWILKIGVVGRRQ